MSSCSRARALLQSVAEMDQLIAELHDLRRRVRRGEAKARAGRHVAARKSDGAVDDLTGRAGRKTFPAFPVRRAALRPNLSPRRSHASRSA